MLATIMAEKCRNPLKPSCKRKDIAVYMLVGDEILPICEGCWRSMAEMDVEWGEDGFKVRVKARKRGRLSSKRHEK